MNANINKKDILINKYKVNEHFINKMEFLLEKENIKYKFIIEKTKNSIIISNNNYEIELKKNDLLKLTLLLSNSIDSTYIFIINIFNDNKVIIKDIKINKFIKLILKKYINNKEEKEIEITLYNKNINNKISKEEKNGLYLYDLSNDSYAPCVLDNTFISFKSINDILYLIYANKRIDIIFYNIIDNKKINEIKKAHNHYITNFRHYYDIFNKRDLVMSISAKDNNIKIWNINNLEFLINIKNINKNGYLNSACFLKDNNEIYIVTSNFYYCTFESIKIFDLKGNKIIEIKESNDKTYFIDTFYDKNLCKNFIIASNIGYIKSYDYNENKIYHKYEDNNIRLHYSFIIHSNKEDIIELIESCSDGNIRIWNFHTGELLRKIMVCKKGLNSIFLWNDISLFIGCDDRVIRMLKLDNSKIEEVISLNQNILTLKFLYNLYLGKILIFQEKESFAIKYFIIYS